MSPQEDSAKQPRRRGRPPKQQAKQPTIQSHQEHSKLADEQLAYTPEEDQLSLFSSFLRHILRHDRVEIARVARELDVSENTIYRWMNGTSEPRAVYLKNLIEALPEHRNQLTHVINQTFPGILDSLSTGVHEVQKDIFRRVMELFTATAESDARRWQITQAIFENALLHLDAERRGLAVTYAKVMPPLPDGIHSLL